MFGTLILLPIYLQKVLGLEPVEIGLMLLPGGLLMGLLGPVVGRLYDRLGPDGAAWCRAPPSSACRVLVHDRCSRRTPRSAARADRPRRAERRPGADVHPAVHLRRWARCRRLYSHGSAIVGTVQQVAGAAGTALFITVMTAVSASQIAGGADEVAALAEGIHTAFVFGAVISLVALAGTFLVREPAEQPQPVSADVQR